MTEGGHSVVAITEYTGVLRRWFRVILSIVVLGALAGTALVALRSASYASQAIVQVRPIVSQTDDPNLDTERQINADTEVAIAGSQRVAERALALRTAAEGLATTEFHSPEVVAAAREVVVDSEAARQAVDRVEISVVADSQILAIDATAAKPEGAQALAQSTAVAYLEFRRDEATAGTDESRVRLAQRESELIAELDQLNAGAVGVGIDDVPASAVLAYAEVAKREELSVIGSKLANLESLVVDPGVVITDAAVPTARDGLPLAAGPIMGGLLGLIGALTAVFLLDRSDDRLRSGRIELSALGVPLLGNAPVARRRRSGGGEVSGEAEVYPVNSPGSDAYRRLQGTLLFNLDKDDKSVVLVAGVNNPAVATSVAANIGATAARAGRRTLVVGADLRHDHMPAHLGTPVDGGLSDIILDGASLGESIQVVDGVDNLKLLGAGNRLDRPADVIQSNAFARLLAAVAADYDLVVVEAPPVLQVADAVDIASLCDGVVVVVDGESESRQSIAESVTQLRSVGSDVVGVVVAEATHH